ncbi:hypothetical protein [Bacillus sp. FJAT-42315]|uniref:hypothetical protein n=1 Tax=Bacillus sp. FJAT-42315 TaxID=2014077 RepID=UPI000C2389B2|nr:hypothetical protein [Bacillus sp. FJAT-42315]
MKKFNYVLVILFAMVMAGCNFNNHLDSAKKAVETSKEMPDLTRGVDKVLTSLEDLSTVVKQSPNETKKIQSIGEQLAENWDEIEKRVEEAFPEDYKNIEESLYPLISEAKKETPNVQKIKPLMTDTKKKITEFKEKLEIST